MTKERSFKRHIRERMSKTGESYAAARSQVSQKRDRVQAARARPAGTADRPSDDKVGAATGRRWEAWFSILDGWGARDRKHGEIVAFLMNEHRVPGWWAQSIGFTIYASRTIAVALEVLFEAFVNPRSRREWFTDGTMSLRTSQPGHTARFDWGDGSTRVSVSFVARGPTKTTVAVAHERLPDPHEAEAAKALWRQRQQGRARGPNARRPTVRQSWRCTHMSSRDAFRSEPRVLLSGLAYVESPRLARRPVVVRSLGRGGDRRR